MRHRSVALSLLLALGAVALPPLQERVKKKGPEDFPALMTRASEAWTAERYGTASGALQKALGLVSAKRREVVLAAFPVPAEGWKRDAEEVDPAAAAMMAGFAGTVVEARYRGPERQTVSLQAMIDSPAAQMMSMMVSNPAMLGKDAELVKYGDHSAILKTKGTDRFELTIVLGDDVLQADARGIDDDALLAMMSQAVVDRLAAAMAQ